MYRRGDILSQWGLDVWEKRYVESIGHVCMGEEIY